jgi:hypothetical protein
MKRPALVVWLIVAIAGGFAVWWLTSYLYELTTLARTDRAAALALFKDRVLPAFVLTVTAAVAGGVLLMRQGLQIVRAGEFPSEGMRLTHETPRIHGRPAVAIGWLLATTGFLLAAVPLAILAVTFWLVRQS